MYEETDWNAGGEGDMSEAWSGDTWSLSTQMGDRHDLYMCMYLWRLTKQTNNLILKSIFVYVRYLNARVILIRIKAYVKFFIMYVFS